MAATLDESVGSGWLIITDLDGTIIDSEASNLAILDRLLDEFGLSGRKAVILKGLAEGADFDDIMEAASISQETRRMMHARMSSLLTQVPKPSLPGAVRHLKILRGLGFIFGLATDNLSAFAASAVDDLGLGDVIDAGHILASDNYAVRKPSEKVVLELLRRAGRSKAIVVGNTPKEVALAKKAGCPVVIIEGPNPGISGARRKATIEYEWEAFGGLDGAQVHRVKGWDGAFDAILRIAGAHGGREGDGGAL